MMVLVGSRGMGAGSFVLVSNAPFFALPFSVIFGVRLKK
jgi:hypothetical protein